MNASHRQPIPEPAIGSTIRECSQAAKEMAELRCVVEYYAHTGIWDNGAYARIKFAELYPSP